MIKREILIHSDYLQSCLDQSPHPPWKRKGTKHDFDRKTLREDETREQTEADDRPHGMLMKDSMGVVPPPQIHTVKKTMSRVVENIIWRA